jgi:sulfate permease, SulP family
MAQTENLTPHKNRWPDQMRRELRPDRLIPSLLAGILIGALEIALAVSFGSLIFSGDLSLYLSRGIGMGLFSGTVGLIIVSLMASHPAIIGGNQDAPAAIVAIMAAAIVAVTATGATLFATVAVMIALATLVTGLFMLSLGVFKLAGLVRFLPYPVAGGFLAGTGWLLLTGGVSMMSGVTLSFNNLPALFQPDLVVYWLPGLLAGFLILVLSTRFRHYLFMPAMIVVVIALFYLVAWIQGATIADLSAGGWLLGPFPEGRLWQPIGSAELAQVDWPAIWSQIPNLIAVIVISSIALLLNASGLELTMRADIDLNREMRSAGMANLAAGLGAGFIGYQQLSLSALNARIGAMSRLAGLFAAAICGLVLFAGGGSLGLLPKVVFGALLAYLGLAFLWEWVIQSWSRLPRIDYLIILMILVVIAAIGFLEGVTVGIVAAVIMFVVSYSRTSVIKHELSGNTFKSRVTRSTTDQAVLEAIGDRAYFLQLQGFIFFGTAHGLLEKVRERINQTATRYVVLDFQQVIGLDSTALLSFDKMRQLGKAFDFILVLAGLSPHLREQFERGGVREEPGVVRFAIDLDRAAEWCEDQLCAINDDEDRERSLVDYLQAIIPGEPTQRLVSYLERKALATGEYLIRQGDDPDQLFLVESGQVTAQLEPAGKAPIRLETMRGGRTVGELGFYLNTRRSAAVVTDKPSVVYGLSQAALARIEEEDPEVAYALHRLIIHLLGERVLHLVRAVDALQQ